MRPRITILLLLCAAGPAALTAPPAGAVVPPRNCGTVEVKGKRLAVKADQLRCRTARTYSRRYLGERRRPRGYRCRDYGRQTKIRFRCSRGIRVFFAIRR